MKTLMQIQVPQAAPLQMEIKSKTAHLRDTRGQRRVDQVHAAPRQAVQHHQVAGRAVVAHHHVTTRRQALRMLPGDVQAQRRLQHCMRHRDRLIPPVMAWKDDPRARVAPRLCDAVGHAVSAYGQAAPCEQALTCLQAMSRPSTA